MILMHSKAQFPVGRGNAQKVQFALKMLDKADLLVQVALFVH
jgi:hypothetical protein